MRKWLLLVLLLLGFVSTSQAEPFLVLRGPIMALPGEGHIVVNETTVSVSPSTSITDEQDRTLDLGDLRCGQWVSVEVEPDGESAMAAKKIVLLQRETSKEDRARRLARVLIVLRLLAAHRHPG
jgi:hypothetical protein